jgi:hypothetical protein
VAVQLTPLPARLLTMPPSQSNEEAFIQNQGSCELLPTVYVQLFFLKETYEFFLDNTNM